MNVRNVSISDMKKMFPGTSKDGWNWMKSALDPFHDYQQQLEGLPDVTSALSLVRMHNYTYDVVAPTAAAGGNWDCMVAFTGLETHNNGRRMAPINDNVCEYDHATTGIGCYTGSVVIQAGAAGASVNMVTLTTGNSHTALYSSQDQDRSRIIGVAIEVHNTTAEVYKQGSLTVAMIGTASTDTANVRYVDNNVTAPGPATSVDYQADTVGPFATTASSLNAVPSSNTWPAAQGVYMIPRLTRTEPKINDFTRANRTAIVQHATTAGAIHPYGIAPAIVTDIVPRIYPAFASSFTPMQAFLTGLSNQTTLRVSVRFIVEYFPEIGSSNLPQATPSPKYDPKIFEIYSALTRRVPYAVQVHENAGGDYFRKVLKTLSDILPIVGAVIPHPVARAVVFKAGAVAGKTAEVVKVIQQRRKAKAESKRISKTSAGSSAIPTRK